ncbi:hypothetical protein Slala02_38330 [Streptomyces lavendulae subsp. lavendulae]|uniref:alpha/beta fold hydrolase n=1 Tax=Streptomyces lavendulae TaxID=1914 RepID=UPI0024A46EC8|nr:alpha/beta hydrolase [Streptomyces lavendulae]GLX20824.1 hypothetical protein Slala01_44680 [Streptomyces lavendulae subsp. lavendulae]GLX28013.1 hypothetical protein Slala02_38330 [Streptomyces lavendulae subsp. lavendulae]
MVSGPVRPVSRACSSSPVPRLIPGARAEIVAATGHGPQIDHPDVVNARMLSFMEDADSLTAPRG